MDDSGMMIDEDGNPIYLGEVDSKMIAGIVTDFCPGGQIVHRCSPSHPIPVDNEQMVQWATQVRCVALRCTRLCLCCVCVYIDFICQCIASRRACTRPPHITPHHASNYAARHVTLHRAAPLNPHSTPTLPPRLRRALASKPCMRWASHTVTSTLATCTWMRVAVR